MYTLSVTLLAYSSGGMTPMIDRDSGPVTVVRETQKSAMPESKGHAYLQENKIIKGEIADDVKMNMKKLQRK